MKKKLKISQIFLIIFLLSSCLDNPQETTPSNKTIESPSLNTKNVIPKKTFQNELFREVTVDRTGTNQYKVNGKAGNSVPSFNYFVEDGHFQLIKGSVNVSKHTTLFGPFNFAFKVNKKNKNTTLTLALVEKNQVKSSKSTASTEWDQGPYYRKHTKNYVLLIPLK